MINESGHLVTLPPSILSFRHRQRQRRRRLRGRRRLGFSPSWLEGREKFGCVAALHCTAVRTIFWFLSVNGTSLSLVRSQLRQQQEQNFVIAKPRLKVILYRKKKKKVDPWMLRYDLILGTILGKNEEFTIGRITHFLVEFLRLVLLLTDWQLVWAVLQKETEEEDPLSNEENSPGGL